MPGSQSRQLVTPRCSVSPVPAHSSAPSLPRGSSSECRASRWRCSPASCRRWPPPRWQSCRAFSSHSGQSRCRHSPFRMCECVTMPRCSRPWNLQALGACLLLTTWCTTCRSSVEPQSHSWLVQTMVLQQCCFSVRQAMRRWRHCWW